ncbi:MAG: type III pantothenate kinase [Candidatus Zixiibacteriota bacterium]|nr:MAG: type III pantothenate kinase [candidate division Zixibacteria bacterium]
MLLAVDIGNTNTVVGVYDNERLCDYFRMASQHAITDDECGFFLIGLLQRMKVNAADIDRVVIASVVPKLTPIYERMSEKYFSVTPLVVSSKIRLPIKIAYEDPTAVGADRIANASAAFVKYGGPIIIVDYGTAITFDVITGDGVYWGGVIAPGPQTAGGELAGKAARLFEVRVEKPDRIIGRSTAESLKSGLFYGTIGLVDAIISLIRNELNQDARVIATGGLVGEFAEYSDYIETCFPALTLEGLKIIADFQSS